MCSLSIANMKKPEDTSETSGIRILPDVQKEVKPSVLSFGAPAVHREESKPVLPSVIFHGGTARKRIEVSAYELRSMITEGCDIAVFTKASQHIRVTNLDDGRDEKFLHWGEEFQRNASKLLDRETYIVHSPVMDASKQEISAIVNALNKLQIGKRGESIAKFEGEYRNLHNLVTNLNARIPQLEELARSAELLRTDTLTLLDEVMAVIIAGKYLIFYCRSGKYNGAIEAVRIEDQMKKLDSRIESLTSIIAMFEVSKLQRQYLAASIVHIIDCVSNTLLVDIPAWRTNYLCVLTAIANGTQLDDAIVASVTNTQQRIVQGLQRV